MKKKILSLLLAVIMIISIMPSSFAEEAASDENGPTVGLENFTKKNAYKPGQFTDFLSSDWFAANVIKAYELGLVKGTTANNFNPKGNITVAETIVLACRIHSIYNGGTGEFTQGSPWYQVYVDYALANKLIPGTYSDYNAKISRANFAFILNNALPAEALREINNIINGALTDVANDNRAEAIYNLYRAGILTGNDKYGTFNPNSNIQRCEVATIVTRMADLTQRKMFMLEEKPVNPESITLAGNTSIRVGETTQWKATIAPARANQWVSWSSGNPSVATVDANGNIKGLKDGQSNITATTGNGIKKTVLVTVKSINSIYYPSYYGVPDFGQIFNLPAYEDPAGVRDYRYLYAENYISQYEECLKANGFSLQLSKDFGLRSGRSVRAWYNFTTGVQVEIWRERGYYGGGDFVDIDIIR